VAVVQTQPVALVPLGVARHKESLCPVVAQQGGPSASPGALLLHLLQRPERAGERATRPRTPLQTVGLVSRLLRGHLLQLLANLLALHVAAPQQLVDDEQRAVDAVLAADPLLRDCGLLEAGLGLFVALEVPGRVLRVLGFPLGRYHEGGPKRQHGALPDHGLGVAHRVEDAVEDGRHVLEEDGRRGHGQLLEDEHGGVALGFVPLLVEPLDGAVLHEVGIFGGEGAADGGEAPDGVRSQLGDGRVV
ncbi:unnamed protein product, partial [Ixodes pacificus]